MKDLKSCAGSEMGLAFGRNRPLLDISYAVIRAIPGCLEMVFQGPVLCKTFAPLTGQVRDLEVGVFVAPSSLGAKHHLHLDGLFGAEVEACAAVSAVMVPYRPAVCHGYITGRAYLGTYAA